MYCQSTYSLSLCRQAKYSSSTNESKRHVCQAGRMMETKSPNWICECPTARTCRGMQKKFPSPQAASGGTFGIVAVILARAAVALCFAAYKWHPQRHARNRSRFRLHQTLWITRLSAESSLDQNSAQLSDEDVDVYVDAISETEKSCVDIIFV